MTVSSGSTGGLSSSHDASSKKIARIVELALKLASNMKMFAELMHKSKFVEWEIIVFNRREAGIGATERAEKFRDWETRGHGFKVLHGGRMKSQAPDEG